jgi:hypothetical protein
MLNLTPAEFAAGVFGTKGVNGLGRWRDCYLPEKKRASTIRIVFGRILPRIGPVA